MDQNNFPEVYTLNQRKTLLEEALEQSPPPEILMNRLNEGVTYAWLSIHDGRAGEWALNKLSEFTSDFSYVVWIYLYSSKVRIQEPAKLNPHLQAVSEA